MTVLLLKDCINKVDYNVQFELYKITKFNLYLKAEEKLQSFSNIKKKKIFNYLLYIFINEMEEPTQKEIAEKFNISTGYSFYIKKEFKEFLLKLKDEGDFYYDFW